MAKPLKYRNTPTVIGAEKYRSKREAAKHQDLLLLQRAGKIADLKREVPYVLAPGVKINGEGRARPALRYVADFVWTDMGSGAVVVADAKGVQTDMYRAKKHLMATVHGIHVIEL